MKFLKQIQILFLLFLSLGAFAQQSVSGLITDSSGTPLPGVNVIIQGTNIGVSSDFDGNYQINVDNGQILVFSYIGYDSVELTVNGANQDVKMTESDSELDEVVVIGYGTVRKKDLTGAVDLVTEKNFAKGSVVSPQQLIRGKVAGVSIVSNSGAPGDDSNVLIRGIGSLNLNSNPLYVVDGIPLDSGGVGGSRSPLNAINPADIEAISILKDASATAIYGSRAANGVVLITTKKGKTGELKFNFSSRSSSFTPIDFVDVLNATQFKYAVQATGVSDYISRLGSNDTDWQKEIYETARAQNNSFSVSGGLLNMPFRASLGYTDQDGILMGDNFNRMTGSFNIAPSLLDGDLRANVNVRFVRSENDFANRGAIGSAVFFDPTKPVFGSSSNYGGYYTWLDSTGKKLALSPTNPLALLNLSDDESTVDRIITNLKLDYDLPIDGLIATVNAGYDNSKGEGFSSQDKNMPTDAAGFNGSNNMYSNETTNLLFDAYLNYALESGKSNLSVTAGHSYQSFEYDNSSTASVEYLNPDGSVNSGSSTNNSFIDTSKNVLLSYFGRVNYSFDEKYLLTATLRADASSKLPSSDRWGQFFSAALAWNFYDDGVDKLKFRVGFGEVGNVNGLGDYNFLTRYVSSDSQAKYGFGNSFYSTYRPAPINKNLRWEVGQTTNFGIDFTFSDLKLNGSLNAYVKKTNDLIATAVIDPFTNFGTTIDANIGDMENKGVEFQLNSTLFESDDLKFDINYNVSINDNKITRLDNEQNVGGIGFGAFLQRHETGKSPYSYYVYKQIYDHKGRPIEGSYADLNGDGRINNDDRYFYKDPYADVLMGLSASITYKDFDLSMASRASLGNYSSNRMAAASNENQIWNLGRLSNVHTSYLDTGFLYFSDKNGVSDHYIQNASFFKLDNVTLGWTVDNVIDNNPMRLYISADNLLTITEYDGVDPEITGGIDSNFYPRSRAIALGLDINF
ncbi:MAG: SusC/RagA family TonB-linked outer membrane protein [Flavobacteriaceae bacterium]|jgi:iron complex outermembrane receptor protein|nr:SusC/RagA family TonB-linked outer membrane protein [Flavobacteriaceae bacterium]MBT4298010.1 SusC/RagA family TonB-linked outer membrane protein [Flavobacteriaceae bacterium]MBT4960872.1 SusC/RagA family TonB-linked outer membrane protein [Flavobacteriaceae bacterium]MBT5492965.1 SusC/RagA family TonB-linked outer membrane protein [Flavobacteriaceae bacterium]MDC0605968.1 SusC/RagA family TonB-linked outer membrane protein [Flavobacteriaceae bacterium]